jgi:hypothetical protein
MRPFDEEWVRARAVSRVEMPLRAFESVLVWYPLGSLPIAKTMKGYCQRNMRLERRLAAI